LPDDESSHADLVAVSLALFSTILLIDGRMGQREHLFVLGFFPYVALRFRRWEGGSMAIAPAIAAGSLGAIAACIKPYFAAIAIVPELYWLVKRRSVRPLFAPESIAFAGGGLAYVLHFLVIPQPMRAAFFGRWVPLVSRGYRIYDMPIRQMVLDHPGLWLPSAMCVVVFVLRPAGRSTAWKFAEPMALIALAAAVSFFLQHKGWPYHAIPAQAAMFVVAGLVGGQSLLTVDSGRSWTRAVLGALRVALAMTLAGVTLGATALAIHSKTNQRLAEWTSGSPVRKTIVRYTNPGDPVLAVSTSAGRVYPMLTQLDRTPASRFLVAFPIPMFYVGVAGRIGQPFPYHMRGDTVPAEEASFRDDLRSDIVRARPKVILLDDRTGCEFCPKRFTVLDYLMRTGFIADAMGNYREAGRVEDFALYLLNIEEAR
jgi:hypothetical protein